MSDKPHAFTPSPWPSAGPLFRSFPVELPRHNVDKVPIAKHAPISLYCQFPQPTFLNCTSTNKPQSTGRRTNLRDAIDPAHRALVPRMVLGTAIRTRNRRHTAVDGCVTRSANVEVGKLIKVDLDDI